MISQASPYVIDSISEPFQLFSGDREFFYYCVFELLFFEGNEGLEFFYFCWSIFQEGHEKGFELKRFKQLVEVIVDVVEAKNDDGGHVD